MVDGNRDGSEISFVLTFLYRFDFLEPCQCIINYLASKMESSQGGMGMAQNFQE